MLSVKHYPAFVMRLCAAWNSSARRLRLFVALLEVLKQAAQKAEG